MENKVLKKIFLIGTLIIGICLMVSCAHKHTYSENWEKDATGHWHQATCNHKEQKSEKESHSFGDWFVVNEATETTTGLESRICSVCKYEETRTIENNENAHTYSKDWNNDSIYHWHQATCTHKDLVSDKNAHSFDANDICSTCKYKKINWLLEEIISSTGNDLYLSSYSILTAQISPNDKACDVIEWKILSGTASLEVMDDGSCKITPTKNTEENEKIEISCTVLTTTKKITLIAKSGIVRIIDLATDNNGIINILNTDAAVYITDSSTTSMQATNKKSYALSLSINTRSSALDIYIANVSISALDKNSVIKYSGNQNINLHLNNVILDASSSKYSALDCTNIELFSKGYCEINGADSQSSTANGGKAIQCNQLIFNVEGTLKIKGGNGFNGIDATNTGATGGNGTAGGTAIHSINVTFNKIPYNTILSITAGKGGNGGNGAQGESKSGKGTAGTGGNGGNGGDSGYCIQGSEICFEMNSIQSTILFVSGNGGNGGRGGDGGIGDQAFLTQPSNGGNGGKGGDGGTSKTPFNSDVVLTGGKFIEFQRVIINDLGFGGAGGNGGNGGNVDKDNINPATGGNGGNGGNGGQIEELYIKIQNEDSFSLSYFSSILKKEIAEKGLGGTAGGTTGNHQGSFNYGSKGYDGSNGERVKVFIEISLFNFSINKDNISYSIIGLNTELSSNIIIPSTYQNLPITRITGIEYNDNLANVYFDGTIEDWCRINFSRGAGYPGQDLNLNPMKYAKHFFLMNNKNVWEEVTTITIPEGITEIGSYQFYGFNSITSITVSDSVTHFGNGAFANCENLVKVNLSTDLSHIEEVDFGLFNDCPKIHYNEYKKGYYLGVKDNPYAILMKLSDYTVENFEFHQDTKIISSAAFAEAFNLEQVAIPNNVTLIGVDAFWNCTSLKNIVLPDGLLFIGDGSFAGCSNLTNITIPLSVKKIGTFAFGRCYRLVEIYNLSSIDLLHNDFIIDENIETYVKIVHTTLEEKSNLIKKDDYVFYKDSNKSYYLIGYQGKERDLSLPVDIEGQNYEIGNYAFYKCNKLTSITLPKSITKIGNNSFEHCYNLVEVYNFSSLIISDDRYGDRTGYLAYYAKIVHNTLEESRLIYKDDYIFYKDVDDKYFLVGYQGKERDLSLPVDIEGHTYELNDGLFYNCFNITSVIIPDSITNIGCETFSGCYRLSKINLGNGIKTINIGTFEYCNSLKNIVIPDSVISIETNAFDNCTSLQSITIGSYVTNIESSAFWCCTNLEKVYYKGTKSDWLEISISTSGNAAITNDLERYYYSATKPLDSGNYWHYVNGIEKEW